MGVRDCPSFFTAVIVIFCIHFVSAQRDPIPKIQVVDGGLSPPYFNLADNRRIYASGTTYFLLNILIS